MVDKSITTPRLLLRRWRFGDVPDVFAYWQEPEMGRFLEGTAEPPSEERTSRIIAQHILVDDSERDVWAIEKDGRAVGGISLSYSKGGRVAEINYHVGKVHWGNGLATEAIRGVVTFGFRASESLLRIEATVDPRNTASIRALQRVGFQHEGTLRAHALVHGVVSNEEIFSLIRADSNSLRE